MEDDVSLLVVLIYYSPKVLPINFLNFARVAFILSVGGYLVLIAGLVYLPAVSQKYPHLFQAGIAIYSFIHYAGFLIYFHFPSPVQVQ